METYEFMRVLGERSNRVDHLYYKWAKAHGISYNVLAVLYVAYKDPESTQKVVCEEWALPKQTVNTLCKQLCEHGYLRILKSDHDGRETKLLLTKDGEELAKPIVEELIAIEAGILKAMGTKEAEKLLVLFNKFCDEAERKLTAAKERGNNGNSRDRREKHPNIRGS